MKTAIVEVPEDVLALLAQSRLSGRSQAEQVRVALSIHLFQEGVISMGKAAELAGEPRIQFERFLGDIGIPPVRYDEAMYAEDLHTLDQSWQAQRA